MPIQAYACGPEPILSSTAHSKVSRRAPPRDCRGANGAARALREGALKEVVWGHL